METQVFSKANIMKFNETHDDKEIAEMKAYVKRYFFKIMNPPSVLQWDPITSSYGSMSNDEFKKLISKNIQYGEIKNEKLRLKRLSDWFLDEDTDIYHLVFKVNRPYVYVDEQHNAHCLNLFKGMPYQTSKKLEMTEILTTAIAKIWTNIQHTICSDKEDLFQYYRQWICNFISGKKMKTIPYLKGTQGSGKSSLPYLLMRIVGKHNCFKTQKNTALTSNFNGQLQGKILLILEELKCASAGEWKQMNSSLNACATEDTVDIEHKGKDAVNVDNNLSIIITSNDSPIQMDKQDRRYAVAEINNDKMNDTAYWDEMYKIFDDETVQCAFYHYCIENAKPWNELAELKKIESETKTEMIINNLHPLYKFIKERYVLQKKDFIIFLKDLTEKYNTSEYAKHEMTNIAITRLLKEVGITGKPSTGNKFRYSLTHDEMLEIFKKNKWMHEMDEFDEVDKAKTTVHHYNSTHEYVEKLEERDNEVEILKQMVEDLKADNKDLKTRLDASESRKTQPQITKVINVIKPLNVSKAYCLVKEIERQAVADYKSQHTGDIELQWVKPMFKTESEKLPVKTGPQKTPVKTAKKTTTLKYVRTKEEADKICKSLDACMDD